MPTFIAYGHKLHTHTHSYIHYGFIRAFQHLGYTTYWLDKNDTSKFPFIDFTNAIFLTEGQVDTNIPLVPTAKYILHNCDVSKYNAVIPRENIITIQTYVNNSTNGFQELSNAVFWNPETREIRMMWATDLLPHEIQIPNEFPVKQKEIVWIGSLNNCPRFGNSGQVMSFVNMGAKYGFRFRAIDPWAKPASPEENRRLVYHAGFAPAIVGHWQKDQGYVPCRIFKNISYGNIGITNSLTVKNLFKTPIIYNSNEADLFLDAMRNVGNIRLLQAQMQEVRDKHTYVSRIQDILTVFK
jgi:hypothetical protein